MEFNLLQKSTSKRLAFIAIIIWIVSLTLTGFSLYSKQAYISGYEILLMGWLSPLVGNFAWFANVFFLYGVVKVSAGKSIVVPSFVAFILSLDLFRYTKHLLNEGGSTSPIYGLGWGAILWLLSIFLLLAASGTREYESNKSSTQWQQPVGFLLFLIVISLSLFWSIYDRVMANPSEKEMLSGIAFKSGSICSVMPPVVEKPLTDFNGTLHIVIDKGYIYATYPFKRIKVLLSWGIPVIQMNGQDYFLNNGQIASIPTKNNASAVLYISEKKDSKGYSSDITAKLIGSTAKRIIFNQTWKRQPYGINEYIYCPNYNTSPSELKQPRKILMDALSIHKPNNNIVSFEKDRIVFKRFEAEIIDDPTGDEKFYSMERKRIHNQVPAPNERVRLHKIYNSNCPLGIGWDGEKLDSTLNIGRPFKINDKSYYPARRLPNVLCDKNFTYLYSGTSSQGKYHLNISKHSLADFNPVWKYTIVLPESLTERSIKIKEVSEENENLTLKLLNSETGLIINAKAKINTKIK